MFLIGTGGPLSPDVEEAVGAQPDYAYSGVSFMCGYS